MGEGGPDGRHQSRLTARLAVLSAGAAQAALTGLAARLGIELQGEFGPVAAMRRRFLDGAACDVLVLTRPMIEELATRGQLSSWNDLGSVRTAIAVRESDPLPDVRSADKLRAALLAAQEIISGPGDSYGRHSFRRRAEAARGFRKALHLCERRHGSRRCRPRTGSA